MLKLFSMIEYKGTIKHILPLRKAILKEAVWFSARAKYLRPKEGELNFEHEGGESIRCLKKRKNLTKMKTLRMKMTLKSSARAIL